MILEIEFYKGDIFLSGKDISRVELKKQIEDIEKHDDQQQDNFIPLLCRVYNWEIVKGNFIPDCVYDRDTRKFHSVSV